MIIAYKQENSINAITNYGFGETFRKQGSHNRTNTK